MTVSSSICCAEGCSGNASNKTGLCPTHYRKSHYLANKQKYNDRSRAYYAANKESIYVTHKAWAKANKEKIAAKHKAYYTANKAEISIKRREYIKSNRENIRAARIARQYGLTMQSYLDMMASQDNSCWICRAKFDAASNNTPCVDHCHDSGKVRGILCPHCNLTLGFIENSKSPMEVFSLYLAHAGGL